MNFDIADLKAFVAVAELASFKRAAELLHISQPALSRRVEKLEQALSLKLLERTTRKVELNAMGRVFLPRAQHVLAELEASLIGMTELNERLHGLVTIACIPSVVDTVVASAIHQIKKQFPRIRLRILDQPAADILLTVARSEVDFGIGYLGASEPDLDFEELASESFVLACRKDHPLATRSSISWSELAHQDCVTQAQGSGNRLLIDQALSNTITQPHWVCEVQHVPSLLSLVRRGVGVGAVPQHAISGNDLCGIPLVEPQVLRSIGLISRRGKALSAMAQELQRALRLVHTQQLN